MLTDRRQRLLRLLLAANGPLAAKEIGRVLGCPARSIRYDLDVLSTWVTEYGVQLVSAAGVGYWLVGDFDRLCAALDRFRVADAVPYEYVLSPKERVRRLLLWLLSAGGPCCHHDLADRLGVSKSTVYNDLTSLHTWAGQRGLTLERGPNGVFLTGEEGYWRQAMSDLIGELADEGQVAILLDDTTGSDPLGALLAPLIPAECWREIGSIVRAAGTPEIAVHLAVMVSRVRQGHALPFRLDQVERAMETDQWPLAQSICAALEHRFHLRLPSIEAANVALLMQTTSLPAEQPGEIPLSEEDLALGRILVMLIQTRLGVPLVQDHELVVGLALHLRPAQYRLRRGQVVENPLLEEIKSKYPAVFQAANDVAKVLESAWQLPLPEPEIGYVAIHIAAALERVALQSEQSPRALVVCGTGIGAAQLLATRLKVAMPDLRVGRVISVFHLKEVLRSESHDLIITTCQVPPCSLPVIRVSPLLTEGDQLKIRKAIQSLQGKGAQGRSPTLQEILTPATIALDVEAADWESAVRIAGGLLVRAGCVEPRYVDAMIRMARELGPYVVFGPGFALPHAGADDGVIRPGFALVRLKHPVAFGHPVYDPVDLLFALGAVDYETHLRALMQLSELFGDPDALAALRGAPDVPTVMAMIHTASQTHPDAVG